VPRIWEKLEEKLAQTIASATGIKKKLLDWAMSIGTEGTFA
jgi:long-subunit acyl-CoA synthetase (AMP-forming)